jgi:hypothetical protein
MKLSIFSPVLGSFSLEEALKYLNTLNVSMLELGCGGYPGTKVSFYGLFLFYFF